MPLKAPKSLCWEHPNFHGLSHPDLKYKITINQDLPIGHQDLLRTSWWVHSNKNQTLDPKEFENEKATEGKRQELGLASLPIKQKN